MEKLNELAELARLCASMKHSVDANAAYTNFICRVEPKDITAIEEAFRALERTSDTNMAAAQAMRDDMYHWKQRAEAAEAILAELAKQPPVGNFYEDGPGSWWQIGPHDKVPHVTPLFDRPAPAAHRVPEGWKLVPVEITQEMVDANFEGVCIGGIKAGYRAMLAAAPEVV